MNNDDLSNFLEYFYNFNGDYSELFEELVTEEVEKEDRRVKNLEKNLIVNILNLLTKDGWLDVLDNIKVVDNSGLVFGNLYDSYDSKIKFGIETKEDIVEKFAPYPNVYSVGLTEDKWNRVDLYTAFSKEYSPYSQHIWFNSGDISGKLILLKNSYSDDYKMFIATGIINEALAQNIQSVILDFSGDFINDPDSLKYFRVEFGKLMSKVC